ncbi:hypothetical protein PCL_12495 [Purpureocillium lilacinum]|uniref:Uncharacterized protein n=1 Tax=Purpureocillium lilacinum TaxID=33203 RepID=A0A2U3E9F7_PURLI|nr:hypothetical protein Purlil1_5178 [Purpureocillium lilacinum]PWI71127.1 hypothetical protein PCL_12495 [Purpureocillium lilacinum]
MPPPHPTWSWRSRQSFSGKRPDEPLESTGMSEPELPSSRSRSATGRNVEANGDGLDYAFKGWRGGNSLLCQRVGRLSSGQREELAWPLGRVRGSPWGSAPIELSDADAAAGEVGAEWCAEWWRAGNWRRPLASGKPEPRASGHRGQRLATNDDFAHCEAATPCTPKRQGMEGASSLSSLQERQCPP